MTGRNANVFYETGYAHALDKRVILLTQEKEDIPFDLMHHTHIIYGGKITTLKSELHKKVQWALENPKDSISNLSSQLDVTVDGMKISNNPVVNIINWNASNFTFYADIHNPVEKEIKKKSFQLALIAPEKINLIKYSGSKLQSTGMVNIPGSNEEGFIHVVNEGFDILPGSYLPELRFSFVSGTDSPSFFFKR